jgi:beta-phosphoglucomutase
MQVKEDPSIKAFIFDLDGVLVDTAKYHFLAWRKLADKLGISLTEKDHESLKGLGRMESLQYILGRGKLELDQQRMEDLAALKNSWYLDYVASMSSEEFLPGVREFLNSARQAGIMLAVGSGSKNASHVLNLIGLDSFFSVICDGNDITHSKPNPEIFTFCCQKLGIDPKKTVVFEDALSGIQAAHAAGCMTIGVGDPVTLHEADQCIPGFMGLTADDILHAFSIRNNTGS